MVLHKKSGSKCKSRSANIVTTGTQGSHPSLNIKLKESKCNFMTTDGRMLSLICRSSMTASVFDDLQMRLNGQRRLSTWHCVRHGSWFIAVKTMRICMCYECAAVSH